jgi:cell division protein ZapB
MTDNNKSYMASEEDLKKLSHRINELIAVCNALKSENTLLKAEQSAFNDEKSRWASYQHEARSRVQTMLERLKSVEQNKQ